jgi:hypothetical protein
MRRTMLVGLVLALVAATVVMGSAAFGLDLESLVLLGAALGAVIALVPDRTPVMRLAGFMGGLVAAWIGYYVRAALLPDTAAGRAVAVGLIVVLCLAVVAASLNRLPLWSSLLGAAALVGAYEYTYAAAPPEVASTSVSTATSLLLTVAVGFVAVAIGSPSDQPQEVPRRRATAAEEQATPLEDFKMEITK